MPKKSAKKTADTVFFVGPWDLDRDLACVPKSPDEGAVLLVESIAKGRALPYHRQKLTAVLSAIHHFAADLCADGFDVEIVRAKTYVDGIRQHVKDRGAKRIVAMMPREYGLEQALRQADAKGELGAALHLHDDGGPGGHFILSRAELDEWFKGRKQARLHQFYAWIRKKTGLLMDGDKPIGGKWSFDSDNRSHARGQSPPAAPVHEPDALTQDIMARVSQFEPAWGKLEGFNWPVTRVDALAAVDSFFKTRAKHFGPYQDAMLMNEPFMWHTLISVPLNLGLLRPLELCQRIEREYHAGNMPLSSAEGLLRQILGWREMIRGIYWWRMPGMRKANLLKAKRRLPQFYWEPSQTDMICMRQSVQQVHDHAYGHHIQRLMVLGNFAMLAEIDPVDISQWFWAAFADAYEWVELPNVVGMAIFADDSFTTKPYAASGSYIDKMSDYCKSCRYNVKQRTGDDACPFNPLFWTFMDKHRPRLEKNPRLRMLYRTWDKLGEPEQKKVRKTSKAFLASLIPANHSWTFDDDAC